MREIAFAFFPSLKLMANIFAPSIGKATTDNANSNIKVLNLIIFGEMTSDGGLHQSMNRQYCVFNVLIYQSSLQKRFFCITEAI